MPRDHDAMCWWLIGPGIVARRVRPVHHVLPPLFPTLLRTTGAGFCYNIGRLAAASGTVYFGSFSEAGDYPAGIALFRLFVFARGRRRIVVADVRQENWPPTEQLVRC